ncbi:CU044_5270 family protein [Nonomuraea sp. NPDC050540]|uniref:CU044_5270 family protein n=1 Tax=Nonomuraea sp. NPDC050540 TaxID=3364367 RepID=UPI0037A3AFE5
MTQDLQEIKSSYDALPGPSATATARARDLLAAGRKPRTGYAKHALRAGTVGLAATVAAVAFMIGPNGGATPANAAELLQHAATAAARQPAPQTGQFVYVKRLEQNWILTLSEVEGDGEHTQEVTHEAWVPAADPGNALTRSTYGRRSIHRGQVPSTMPTPGTVDYQTGRCAADVLPVDGAGNLPTDPGELLARVRADAEASVRNERPRPSEDQVGPRVDVTVAFRLITLAQNPFPGVGLREAVFGALSKLPAATMRTDLTDPAGRQGIGASIDYQGPDGRERTELIFEPGTYRFLGWRNLSEGPDGAEVLRAAVAMLEAKIVDTMPHVAEARAC